MKKLSPKEMRMKVNEIKVGSVYTNGKRRQRRILEEGSGPDSGCLDYDKVRYTTVVFNKPGHEPITSGDLWMTRRRFADWAKAEVKEAP